MTCTCARGSSPEHLLQFRKRFKPKQAESVIHEVLQEKLKGKVYAVDQVTALTKELSEAVKAQLLKELDIPRYKVIVQVRSTSASELLQFNCRLVPDARGREFLPAYECFPPSSGGCVRAER